MIKITDKGISVDGDLGDNGSKLLWDLLNVIGRRFVILAELEYKDVIIDYKGSYDLISRKKDNLLLFNCSSEEEFMFLLEVLSENCITDFYITVDSFYKNVLEKMNGNSFFSDKGFEIDKYLNEFNKTIHIEEDKFFIDFELFEQYVYPLQRVAKRYKL